jgi:fibronectin-binding autotransporter adhesin
LFVGSASAFADTSALVMSGSSTFNLSGNQATVKNLTATSGNTITTSGSGTDTDVFTISGLSATAAALFTDGTTRKLALTINGTGTVDPLSNASNTFSGGLSLTNARISVVDNSAITGGRYGTGVITIGTGSQMYYNAANRTVSNDIVVNANSNVGSRTGAFRVDTTGNVLSGTITAGAADAMFNVGGGTGGLTITGKITGASGLQARNTNGTALTLTLSNAAEDNDYSGNTSIGEATVRLVLGASNQIANGAGKGNLTATGTLDLAGYNETINGLSGAGIIEGGATGTVTNTFTLGDGDANGLTFSGVIQNTAGTLSLTKIGTGTQILTGANTYTGATLISSGTLQIGNGGTTGALSSSSAITNNGTLSFNRTNTVTQGTDFASGLSGNGALTTSGTGTLILSGTNNYAGSTTISNGELRVTSANAIAGTSGITVNSGRFALDGSITTGSGKSITINGSGGNFFGALQGNSGNNVWEGDVVIGSTAGTRLGVNAGTFRVNGVISGSTVANGITLRPNAGTVLELAGASTYAGDTTIISGTGVVTLSGGSNRLPTGTRLIFGASATSGILNLNGQNQEIAGLSVISGTANEIRSTDSAVLTVNTATASPSNWAGRITGAISLTKTGSETLTLTAANTYSGATTVTQGSLVLSGAGSVANSGRIHLAASTTLDVRGVTGGFTLGASQSLTGVGTISALGQTVTAAGTLSPGNSPGALIQDGGILALGAGGNLNLQVYDATGSAGVGYDTVSLINNATLSLTSLSNANPYLINLWSLSGINSDVNGNAINFDASQNYSWTLFSTSSEITDFSSDLFQINVAANNGTSGFSNSLNGGVFTVALADNNTDLVLQFTAIPETSVTLLGGLSALLLLRRKRRIA